MKKENIALIGFAGCGKTSAGARLSEILGFAFIDTDSAVEERAGLPIPLIFEKFGEARFRELEAEITAEAARSGGAVIATGGGVIKNPENMRVLKESGKVVYMRVGAEEIYERLRDDNSRPLLLAEDKLGRIRQLMDERAPVYEKYADISADVGALPPEGAARLIISRLGGEGNV
ncbi:MAG: shikimate kinase [Clostridiales bacterium]|jgi:shikimate kinase|nr:shikimate kinase [Clostridiales bacterium]